MRLIDADALRELIDGGFDIDFDETPEVKAELLKMIDYQETIDAAPIRRGKWIDDIVPWAYACSICGRRFVMDDASKKYHFCPYCGAKMEGET